MATSSWCASTIVMLAALLFVTCNGFDYDNRCIQRRKCFRCKPRCSPSYGCRTVCIKYKCGPRTKLYKCRLCRKKPVCHRKCRMHLCRFLIFLRSCSRCRRVCSRVLQCKKRMCLKSCIRLKRKALLPARCRCVLRDPHSSSCLKFVRHFRCRRCRNNCLRKCICFSARTRRSHGIFRKVTYYKPCSFRKTCYQKMHLRGRDKRKIVHLRVPCSRVQRCRWRCKRICMVTTCRRPCQLSPSPSVTSSTSPVMMTALTSITPTMSISTSSSPSSSPTASLLANSFTFATTSASATVSTAFNPSYIDNLQSEYPYQTPENMTPTPEISEFPDISILPKYTDSETLADITGSLAESNFEDYIHTPEASYIFAGEQAGQSIFETSPALPTNSPEYAATSNAEGDPIPSTTAKYVDGIEPSAAVSMIPLPDPTQEAIWVAPESSTLVSPEPNATVFSSSDTPMSTSEIEPSGQNTILTSDPPQLGESASPTEETLETVQDMSLSPSFASASENEPSLSQSISAFSQTTWPTFDSSFPEVVDFPLETTATFSATPSISSLAVVVVVDDGEVGIDFTGTAEPSAAIPVITRMDSALETSSPSVSNSESPSVVVETENENAKVQAERILLLDQDQYGLKPGDVVRVHAVEVTPGTEFELQFNQGTVIIPGLESGSNCPSTLSQGSLGLLPTTKQVSQLLTLRKIEGKPGISYTGRATWPQGKPECNEPLFSFKISVT